MRSVKENAVFLPEGQTEFAHDWEIVSITLNQDQVELGLVGENGNRYCLIIPDIIEISTTGFRKQNVLFGIMLDPEIDELRDSLNFSVHFSQTGELEASQYFEHRYAQNNHVVLLDATVGLGGFIVTEASLPEIQLIQIEKG